MIERAHVIGAGRVGSAIAARLRERGLDLDAGEPELVLLCVPDRAIAEVAAATAPGPWLAHVSGATPLARARAARAALRPAPAADVHARPRRRAARRRVRRDHRRDGGSPPGRRLARAPARPRAVPARRRAACDLSRRRGDRLQLPRHAAARRRLAARGGRRAARGARPADAADDRERLRADRPDRARRLGDRRRARRGDPRRAARARAAVHDARRDDEGTPMRTLRTISRSPAALQAFRRGGPRPGADDGRAPRGPPGADRGGARRVRHGRRQRLRQPGAVRRRAPTSPPIRATRSATGSSPPPPAPTSSSRPPRPRCTRPGYQTWVEVEELSRGLEGEHRPGHFRGVATVCLKLFNDRAAAVRVLRPEGRPAARGRPAPGSRPQPRPDGEIDSDRARPRRARPLLAGTHGSPPRNASARSLSRARSRPAIPTPPARCSTGSTSTTSRSPTSIHPSSPPPSASAPPA